MNSSCLQGSNIGKIINMISSDVESISGQVSYFGVLVGTPFVVLGATAMLVVLLGWTGIVGTVVTLLALPLSNWISSRNGDIKD